MTALALVAACTPAPDGTSSKTPSKTTPSGSTSTPTGQTTTPEPTSPTTPTGTPTGDTASAPTQTGRDYSTDRGLFFGDSRCDLAMGAGVWLCDGFEAGAIDYGVWSPHDWAAGPELDLARAARGAGSLHFHTDGNGFSSLVLKSLFPVTDDSYWGRLFVWFDSMPTAPDWAHWTIVGAAGPDVSGEIRVGGQYNPFFGGDQWGVGSDGGATGDWMFLDDDGGPVATPTGQWLCIEWQHDATNDETRFYWDAIEHPSLATTADLHGGDPYQQYLLPSFDSVWIGWWLYQGDPSPDHYDLWIDEVAFDGERIGCVL